MTRSVEDIFEAAGLEPSGAVRWGEPVTERRPGVYVASLSVSLTGNDSTIEECPIDLRAIDELLSMRPELRLDGARPTPDALAARISSFWLPDEVVLYVGLAGSSVRQRVGQYYRTPLGARKPHAGGWFLKVLSCLPDLTVHFGAATDPARTESAMLQAFCAGVSTAARPRLHDPEHPFPFANLEWPAGTRKRHGITGAKGELSGEVPLSEVAAEPRLPRVGGGGEEAQLDASVSGCIQQQLRIRALTTVTAVEAARWLDEAGVLADSPHRPGLPLRNLLRDGRIAGQRQEPNRRWFIDRVE